MDAPSALIGHTGFVGGNLSRQRSFDEGFNSASVGEMRGRAFSRIVCAGVSATKWLANKEPDADWAAMQRLIDVLATITADHFVLISTVDVYADPVGVSEDDPADLDQTQAYGRHRARLEAFVRERFAGHSIVRLPALFGTGLKKNALFDLLHDNRVDLINPRGSFQWYPLARLGDDLDLTADARLDIVNMATEPVTMEAIRARFFPDRALAATEAPGGLYDMRSRHAALFGGADGYCLRHDTVMTAMAHYIESERRA